jgi:hypothetical protein
MVAAPLIKEVSSAASLCKAGGALKAPRSLNAREVFARSQVIQVGTESTEGGEVEGHAARYNGPRLW